MLQRILELLPLRPSRWQVWRQSPLLEILKASTQFLIHEMGTSQIRKPDKHRNTMLHYLASTRAPNESLIDWLKLQETGASVWQEAVNFWGHTR